MSAATSNQPTTRTDGKSMAKGVKADSHIYGGSMVAIAQATGLAEPASDKAAITVIGIAKNEVSGDSGDRVEVERGIFLMENDSAKPVLIKDINKPCFVLDDSTVSIIGGTNSVVAGRVHDVTPEGVFVDFACKQ